MTYATAAPSSAPTAAAIEVVGRALEGEHLDEVAAPGSDRARDAELPAALRGEHDEDQEDEQDPRRDRERPERREERHERLARLLGGVERVLLRRIGLEAERSDGRLQRVDDLVGEGNRVVAFAPVRDQDPHHPARLLVEPLGLAERHEERLVGRSGAVEVDDRADAHAHRVRADEDDQWVAGANVQRVGALLVQVELTRRQLRQGDLAALDVGDRPEAVHLRRVRRKEGDGWLCLPLDRRLHGDVLADRPRHAVRQVLAGQLAAHDARRSSAGSSPCRSPHRAPRECPRPHLWPRRPRRSGRAPGSRSSESCGSSCPRSRARPR